MRPAASRFLIAAGLVLTLSAAVPGQSVPASAAPASQDSLRTTQPGTAAKAPGDTVSARPKSRADTVLVAKHHFNHREQIITGSVIMTCIALMMVTMNNYNPR